MMKKIFVILISLFIFSGCSVKQNEELISFASWGSITEVKILKQIIADFEEENPNIKINFMHIPQNYFQKIHLLFASNTPPDVIFINNLYLPIYASKLEDLSNYIDDKEFFEQAITGLSYENKLLAIPRDISNLVFYINSDLVQDISNEWTLEDFLEIAKKSTKKEQWGAGFEEDIYYLFPYLSYYGEKFDNKFLFEESKGLRFYKDLRDKYQVVPKKSQVGSSTLAQMFLDKKIAMYLSGRWMYPKIREKADFQWTIKSFPVGKSPLPCDCSGWAISKDSKHKDSAIKFVRYLSGEKSAEVFTKTDLITPARKSASLYLNDKKHNDQVFIDIISKSKNTFVTKDYKKLVDNINLRIQED